MKILILADSREKKVIQHFSAIPPRDIVIKEEQIDVGDYHILGVDDNNNIISRCAVIERKSLDDFGASIVDGRMENTAKLLGEREKYNSRIIFIVEGPYDPAPSTKFGGVAYKNIVAKIDHLIIRDNICIIRTRNEKDTAERLEQLAQNTSTLKNIPKIKGADEQTEDLVPLPLGQVVQDMKIPRHKTTDGERAVDILSSISNVGESVAKRILEKYSITQLLCGDISRVNFEKEIKNANGRKLGKKTIDAIYNLSRTDKARILSSSLLDNHDQAAKLLNIISFDGILLSDDGELDNVIELAIGKIIKNRSKNFINAVNWKLR